MVVRSISISISSSSSFTSDLLLGIVESKEKSFFKSSVGLQCSEP
jgi:hypothetical protein